jgi:hypothetical protein
MTKYELEKTKSLLEVIRELTFQHIPEIYSRGISIETSKALDRINKEIEEK